MQSGKKKPHKKDTEVLNSGKKGRCRLSVMKSRKRRNPLKKWLGEGSPFDSNWSDEDDKTSLRDPILQRVRPLNRLRPYKMINPVSGLQKPANEKKQQQDTHSRESSTKKRLLHRSLYLLSVTLAASAVVVSISVLLWLLIQQKHQMAALESKLNNVLQDRQDASDSNHRFHARLAELGANQTALHSSLSKFAAKLDLLTLQFQQLNSTVKSFSEVLGSLPYLKSLPDNVKELQKEVAGFGSRLTDMETTVKKAEEDMNKKLSEHRQLVDTVESSATSNVKSRDLSPAVDDFQGLLENQSKKFEAEMSSLNGKLLDFGANMSRQFDGLVETMKKNWKLLGEVQNDVKHVSEKASSNELNIKNFEQRVKRGKV